MIDDLKSPQASDPNGAPPAEAGVGDRNVERLLAHAYKPEAPGEEFAKKIEAQMWFAAQEAAKARAESSGDKAASASTKKAAPGRGRWVFALAAAAALIFMAFGLGMLTRKPGYYREGGIVWIEGQPYYAQAPGTNPPRDPLRPDERAPLWVPVPPKTAQAESFTETIGYDGLTPRPVNPAAVPVERAETGAMLATGAGQKRRATLPDGSVLYLNESTQVKIEADRRVSLVKGEVFVEVSPRDPKMKDGDPTFVVEAKERSFTAFGTKFAVRADDGGAKLVVTQGKVKVSGFQDYVLAGQQLKLGKAPAAAEPSARANVELDWTRDLMAAAASPLVPASTHTGGSLIAVDPYGQEVNLSLRSYHVDVYIQDGFARTTIDQTYFNASHWRMEGTFYFPLPPDASLSRLAMYVGEDLMEGGMADRDHARNVYEQIVRRQKDPALLEWVDGSTFKMRVFPLEARQEKRIVLSYTQRLPELSGETTYRFPAGHNLALVKDWSMKMFVQGGGHLLWNASHTLTEDKKGDNLELRGEQKLAKLDRDLVVRLCQPGGQAEEDGRARFSLAEYEGAKYLMVRYRPELAGLPAHPRRDWVFLVEADGSRDPVLARVQVDVIRTLLENAEHDDTFAILTAGTRVRAFAKEALPATPENIKAASEFLNSTHLVGALDLGQALTAARPYLEAAKNPHLVHLGSAVPTLGERTEAELLKRIPSGTHYVGVGVGKRWGRAFMKNAAARDGGYFTQINPDEQIGWRAFELLATLNAPRLLDLKIVDDAENAVFLGFNDSLAQGEEVCAVTRVAAGAALPEKITITGRLDGKPWQKALRVNGPDGSAGYLPRAWTKLEIDRLLADNADANKDRIIELSKAMYVMSPFTSLLVLENKEMYAQFNVDTGRKDHWAMYPCPAKIPIVYEPEPGYTDPRSIPTQTQNVAEKRPSPDQVLASILVRMPPRTICWPNQPNYGIAGVTAQQLFTGTYGYAYYYYGRDWDRERRAEGMSKWAENLGVGLKDVAGQMGQETANSVDAPMEAMAERAIRMPMNQPVLAAKSKRIEYDAISRLKAGNFKQRERKESDVVMGLITDSRSRMEYKMRSDFSHALIDGEFDGYEGNFLQYQAPYFSGDYRVFNDLVRFAPGMNTRMTDIQAVVEAEAEVDPRLAPGRIEAGARALIEKARGAGWQTLSVPAENGEAAYDVVFDGTGRYAYRRTLASGLEEQAWCDGDNLWMAYSEIGLASRRPISRFHRQDLTSLLPTFVQPAEDLARGADVILIDAHTVAVVPASSADRKDKDGKPVPYARLHLIFNEDGSLAERRWVEMPSGKTLLSERISNGALTCQDANGATTYTRKLPLSAAAAPALAPKLDGLVVLPMPTRTQDETMRKNKQIQAGAYEQWPDEDALAAIGAASTQNVWEAQQIVARRFFLRGDRRLGFYTLLLAGNASWDPKEKVSAGNTTVTFDPVADHPGSAVARYLAEQVEWMRGKRDQSLAPVKGGALLQNIGTFRNMYNLWSQGKVGQMTPAERTEAIRTALNFVAECPHADFAWAMLNMVHNYGGMPDMYRDIAQAYKRFENDPELKYHAMYERARWLCNANDRAEAQKLYTALVRESLDGGHAPRMDYGIRQAFQSDEAGQKAWSDLIREGYERLLKKGSLEEEVVFAWQVMSLGDPALGEEIVARALGAAGASDADRKPTTLAAAQYYNRMGQYARAETLITGLLTGKEGRDSSLWRLAANVANQRGQYARGLAYLETAMEMEYHSLRGVVDVQEVRQDYSALMERYHALAEAVATLQAEAPKEFVAKVVRAADRWRAIDTDPTQACQAAARTLQALGAQQLAWDYLTTPLAEKPNEAAPWLQLAEQLRSQGSFELADRAFVLAFEAEPTNAQILWDRGQNQLQWGHTKEASECFRKIVEGTWQPGFDALKRQAQNFLDWQR